MVEHFLGKEGVVSPILTSGTIFEKALFGVLFSLVDLRPTQSDFYCLEKRDFKRIIGLFTSNIAFSSVLSFQIIF